MPNIILVTIDSLRADHLGCYGYDRDTSPTIDALASRGLQFDGYANAPATRSSFPSILTSTYPLEYGGFRYLSEKRQLVSQPLSAGGYRTGGFHSNLWLSRDYDYDRGFDTFYDSKSDPTLTARLRSWVKLHLPQDTILYSLLQRLYDTTEEKAGMNIGNVYQDAETITDSAIDWLDSTDEELFCWVHYMDVHHPYVPRDDAAAELGLELNCSQNEAIRLRRLMLEEPEALTEAERETIRDLYDAEIRYTDTHISRLLDAAEAAEEETAVVLTADHGEELGDHGVFGHGPTLYDELLHVPFVVDPPESAGVDASGPQDEPLELLDVAPTVCDLAGVDAPANYRGRSALDVAGSDEDVAVISETDLDEEYKLSLREGGWKFIWDRERDERELFDLDADPGETANLVDDEPQKADEMREVLLGHIEDLRESNEALPDVRMDSTTEERLKDLGYLD